MKINEIKNRLFPNDDLSKKVQLNLKYLIIVKPFSIILNYFIVKISYNYLCDNAIYGAWVTILSVLTWINNFDIGLGSGLKNKLTESIAKNDFDKGKIYVSTAYAAIGIITLIFIIIYFIGSSFLDWNKIFNIYSISSNDLSLLLNIVVIFYLLRFLFSLINPVAHAFQNAIIPSIIILISNAIIIIILIIFQKINIKGIVSLGSVFSIVTVGNLMVFSILLYKSKYKIIKPTFNKIKMKYTNDLFKLGLKFFIIQISTLIIFATDNMIITQILGPQYVTPYYISFKLFGIFIIGFSIIMTPLWSAYNYAYTKGDYKWIQSILKKLLFLMIPLVICITLAILFSENIIKIWISNKVEIPVLLTILMGVYSILVIWNNIFTILLGGINKIRLGVYIMTFTASINIPLSILLAKQIGISGVILATICCLFITSLISPIQVWYFIYSKRKSKKLNKLLS